LAVNYKLLATLDLENKILQVNEGKGLYGEFHIQINPRVALSKDKTMHSLTKGCLGHGFLLFKTK
jgi:hypothetical protein